MSDSGCNTPGFAEHFLAFNENNVFERITGEDNQYFGTIGDPDREFSDPFIARTYLDLINLALGKGEIDDNKESALVASLLLPDVHCQVTPLQSLYSSASLPSSIPGLELPCLLHADLAAHPIFRRKKWRRPKYSIDRFLEGDALQVASDETRRQFWKWLQRNQKDIGLRTRTKLADLAIWPDENSRLCRISDLCAPRSQRIAAILTNAICRPHQQVRSSKLTFSGGRARTLIRHVPTDYEIEAWLDSRLGFHIGSTPNAIQTNELNRFETDVAMLLRDANIARLLKATAVTLPTLAQDGSIQPRTMLVKPSRDNNRLALPARFLLKNPRLSAALDKLSQALSKPTADMLFDALVEDPRNFSALHPRLIRFFIETTSGDDERFRLMEMPILPVHGQLRAPAGLAFKGNKGDYWGGWKTRISGKGLSQDEQDRYRTAGVTPALPNATTSRDFFAWLSNQDQTIVKYHIPSVLRHILHPQGPTAWAESYTDTAFIPTKGQDGLRLVSLRTARRKLVYLPDAGSIGEDIIQRDRRVQLVIHRVMEVSEPASEVLRKLGVRSLREALNEPKSVTGSGKVVPVGEIIRARFRELQSTRFRRTFPKRLNELGVESKLVRRDWQDRLDRIREIRLAEKVEVRYRFGGKSYVLNVDAGFDPESDIFWMKSDQTIRSSTMYETLAKQLIFKAVARPIHLLALERAVDVEIDDPSFGHPTNSRTDASGTDLEVDYDGQDEMDADPGEAAGGHAPFEPNPARNRPNPNPLLTKVDARRGNSTGDRGSADSDEDRSGSRHVPQLEKTHIDDLKRDHYASHCQMCLCERTPRELAPTDSYVEWAEVRRKIIEAHHTDPVSAGGARHAGNLILLCKFHHDNYGGQLSRTAITTSLLGNTREKFIAFNEGTEIKGQQIELTISGTGKIINLFFTNHHAKHWLLPEG